VRGGSPIRSEVTASFIHSADDATFTLPLMVGKAKHRFKQDISAAGRNVHFFAYAAASSSNAGGGAPRRMPLDASTFPRRAVRRVDAADFGVVVPGRLAEMRCMKQSPARGGLFTTTPEP